MICKLLATHTTKHSTPHKHQPQRQIHITALRQFVVLSVKSLLHVPDYHSPLYFGICLSCRLQGDPIYPKERNKKLSTNILIQARYLHTTPHYTPPHTISYTTLHIELCCTPFRFCMFFLCTLHGKDEQKNLL